MKVWKNFPVFGWILVGVLTLSALFITLSRSEMSSNPSASSYGPSGAKAFAELLERSGYHVRYTYDLRPTIESDETMIGFYEPRPNLNGGEDMPSLFKDPRDITMKVAGQHGHNVMLLGLRSDFQKTSTEITGSNAQNIHAWGHQLKVSTSYGSGFDSSVSGLDLPADFVALASDDNSKPIASIGEWGSSRIALIPDGAMATNRFLGIGDNATFVLGVLQHLAPAGSKVVFVDSTYSEGNQKGLAALIGNWAVAASWQCAVLFLVLIYSLGKPFGLPEPTRFRQRGTRELVDGLAAIFRRGRADRAVMGALLADADREIRHRLKLPRDASRQQRDAMIPGGLRNALAEAEAAGVGRIPTKAFFAIARKLEKEMDDFLNRRPATESAV